MKWQQETFLQGIQHYFISGVPHEEDRILGWNTGDGYEDCPRKYVEFFKNIRLDYDWYLFIDDDTFLFPDRLKQFIKNFDHTEKVCIGHKCDCTHLDYIDGGAGILMSRVLYESLQEYVKETPYEKLLGIHRDSKYGDVSLGLWIRNIPDTRFINNRDLFKHFKHVSDDELKTCVTFHNVKSREDFQFYFNNGTSR
jgi:hypothetical protein